MVSLLSRFEALQRPLSTSPPGKTHWCPVNFSGLATALDMRFKVAFFLGLILSSPWWLYQLWAYVAPGFTGKEKRYTVGFVAAAVPLFLGGIAAGWYIFPHAVEILASFRPDGTQAASRRRVVPHLRDAAARGVWPGLLFPWSWWRLRGWA